MGAFILRSTDGLMIWENGKTFEYLSESKERHLRTNSHCFGYLRFLESDSFSLEIQPIRDFREWGFDQSDFCKLIVQPICNFRSHIFNQWALFRLKFQWMTEFQYRTFNRLNSFALRVYPFRFFDGKVLVSYSVSIAVFHVLKVLRTGFQVIWLLWYFGSGQSYILVLIWQCVNFLN
jgi:hypothetical protein